MTKTAVVLFNLGGPDRPEAVRPFLFNLFNDPAIIGAPGPIRWLLARLISSRRAPVAREIYAHLGGASPLLANTEAQAAALEAALDGSGTFKTFICMRYWHPMSLETAAAVKRFAPERVVLLPLYPQFSTTTTGSSLKAWHDAAAQVGLSVETMALCCYPRADGFIEAVAEQLRDLLNAESGETLPRVLFSAHGLPQKIVAAGDPYQWQVEQTAAAVVERLAIPGLDWLVCYQSRVGPLAWIGPSTDDEIERAGAEGKGLVVVPIAFVSEHSETLVELDIEYRTLAEKAGVPVYHRLSTVAAHDAFIAALAAMVRDAAERPEGLSAQEGQRICPGQWVRCPLLPVAGEPVGTEGRS